MCIKYEASGQEERPNPPGVESKPSKEELERQVSMLQPTKSPDKDEC